jgi:hypothetical protein
LVKKREKSLWEKQGKRGRRENLVAGRRKKEKDLIAPMVLTGSLDARGFEGWLSLFLIPSLTISCFTILAGDPTGIWQQAIGVENLRSWWDESIRPAQLHPQSQSR